MCPFGNLILTYTLPYIAQSKRKASSGLGLGWRSRCDLFGPYSVKHEAPKIKTKSCIPLFLTFRVVFAQHSCLTCFWQLCLDPAHGSKSVLQQVIEEATHLYRTIGRYILEEICRKSQTWLRMPLSETQG